MNGLETVGAEDTDLVEEEEDELPPSWRQLLAVSRTGLHRAEQAEQERVVAAFVDSLIVASGKKEATSVREKLAETFRLFLLNETFSFTDEDGTQYLWNVTEGLKFLASSYHAVETFYPGANGVTVKHLQELYPDLDEEKAKGADLSVPVLFIPFKGSHLLIDGWHRMYRAVSEGRESVSAYVLTEREMEAILLLTDSSNGTTKEAIQSE